MSDAHGAAATSTAPAPDGTAALEVRGLEAGYGKIQVLWGIDLTVPQGSFVTIIGANGAGKTTLLRAVSGLVPGVHGEVRALGQDLRGRSPAHIVRAGVGHVPEGRQLFPLMSVEENLNSGADYLPDAAREADRSRAMVLELFPRLAERHRQLAGTLSGGEQQMVAIGRALMSAPRALLLDEPFLGLAPIIVSEIQNALASLKQEGLTILLVEQKLDIALSFASRAYVMIKGNIALAETSDALLKRENLGTLYFDLATDG
jgi:branched-chain amino acid transport system ATP-binding protein